MDKIVKNILLNNFIDFLTPSEESKIIKLAKLIKRRRKARKIAALQIYNQKMCRQIPKYQNFFHTITTYPEDIFYSHYRMNRNTFQNLLKMVKSEWIYPKTGHPAYSIEQCLYITLWKLGNKNSFREIGDRFGVGTGTAHKIVKKTVKAISKLKNKVIKWPTEKSAQRKVVEEFEKSRSNPFPSSIGCIDGHGMHVNISAPFKDSASYYNRKGNHSLIVQGVVDSNFRFLDAFVGYPGRCHDASVWQNSPLKKALTDRTITLPSEYHLLGDSAYPLEVNLMVPYRDNGFLTTEQKNFNTSLSSTRVFIEQAYGILKKKFRILHFIDIRNLPFAKHIIMSCIVIHNIILNFETYNVTDIDFDDSDDVATSNNQDGTSSDESINNDAKRKRELLTTLISA